MRFLLVTVALFFTLSGNTQINFEVVTRDTLALEAVELPTSTLVENRLEMPFSDNSRTIEIITQADLAAAPIVNISEALRYVTGIDLRQRGPHGVQGDLSIRGSTFEQTLVLINGVKMSDPQTGHHMLNIPIDWSAVERIEVLKGPGARIYGQNAFAGAVNIVTKTPNDAFLTLGGGGGQNGQGSARMTLSLPNSNFKQLLSVSRDWSAGYQYNTDYDIANYFYQNSFKFVNKEIGLMAGFTERRFGANGFYASPDFRDQYEEIQTSIVALSYREKFKNWTVKPRVYWRRNQDEYVFIRSNPSAFRNLHISQVIGAEVHSENRNRWGKTGLGVEGQFVQLQSNNLGDWDRQVVTAYAEHRFSWFENNLDVTPGVQLNYYSDFDANFLPGVDVGYRFDNQWKTFANIGYTFRVPTYTDLYYQDRANIGNPDLQPESAVAYEVGVKYRAAHWSGQVALFRRDGNDLIDWARADPSLPWQPDNFGAVDVQGAELSIDYRSRGILRKLHAGYTYIDAQQPALDVAFSRYALENLRHQFVVSTDFMPFGKWQIGLFGRYLDRVSMDDYALLDTRLTYQGNHGQLFVEATNVLNTTYRETNLVTMPGRWIRCGFNYRFDINLR